MSVGQQFTTLGVNTPPGSSGTFFPALVDPDLTSIGATLATALTAGTAYTAITVGSATAATTIPSGAALMLASGSSTQLLLTTAAATLSTSANTTISVSSFAADFAYPIGATVAQPNFAVPIRMWIADSSGAFQPVASAYPMPTQQVSSIASAIVFQAAAGAVGNGATLAVSGLKTLTVEVFGASSPSGTVSFMGASTSGTYAPISGTRLDTLAQATDSSDISTIPVLWQFEITGLVSVEIQITAWTAGTITVQGQAVA